MLSPSVTKTMAVSYPTVSANVCPHSNPDRVPRSVFSTRNSKRIRDDQLDIRATRRDVQFIHQPLQPGTRCL